MHWLQPDVGHYGVFNGSRFRAEIAPRIADFVLSNNGRTRASRPRAANGSGRTVNGNGGAHGAVETPPAAARGPSPREA